MTSQHVLRAAYRLQYGNKRRLRKEELWGRLEVSSTRATPADKRRCEARRKIEDRAEAKRLRQERQDDFLNDEEL
jgi:hypothetical protein